MRLLEGSMTLLLAVVGLIALPTLGLAFTPNTAASALGHCSFAQRTPQAEAASAPTSTSATGITGGGSSWTRREAIGALAGAIAGPSRGLRGGSALSMIGPKVGESPMVMVNGLPGNMGREVAAACLRKGMRIAPYGLTGPNQALESVEVDDGEGGPKTTVKLIKDLQYADGVMIGIKAAVGADLVVVDYTHPDAVNTNAEWYAANGLNFVMGTTGGDREKLLKVTEDSGVYAVIAPNMGKQIVALQATIDHMAKEYPGSFDGYSLTITESHQKTKADTSGTAKALAQDFATLTGKPFEEEDIVKIRTEPEQMAFGVPEDALTGHAFHTYSLKSEDGSVEFQFQHNVCGRRFYAEGTADALAFLHKRIIKKDGGDKKVYNMIDVLKKGGI